MIKSIYNIEMRGKREVQQPQITIVIPVYNVEKYLERCLKSIVNQTYKNLEILLIDDESPDKCPMICDNWAKLDNRISVIHKKNAGLGMARNTGIENASGDYICFVDSDDYIELDIIEKAYKKAAKFQADIVYYGYNVVSAVGKVIKTYKPEIDKLVYVGKSVTEEILPELVSPNYSQKKKTNLMLSACTALFSMDAIKRTQWKFVSEREVISEDVYSLVKLFSHITCVAVIPEAAYYYCQNGTSLTRTYREDRYQSIKALYDKVILLCDTLNYPVIVKTRFASVYLAFVIATLKLVVLSDNSMIKKIRYIRAIEKDPHLKEVLSKIDLKIESGNRKLIRWILLKEKTMLCYLVLLLKYKLK